MDLVQRRIVRCDGSAGFAGSDREFSERANDCVARRCDLVILPSLLLRVLCDRKMR